MPRLLPAKLWPAGLLEKLSSLLFRPPVNDNRDWLYFLLTILLLYKE